VPLCLNSFRSAVPAVSAHDAMHRRKIAAVEGWTMRCWRRGRKMWSAKTNGFWWCVRGRGSNVLAAKEIWKGARDVIGRGNARRTGPLFCEKRAVQNGRQHTMCHKPFYLKI